eukprot:504199_1
MASPVGVIITLLYITLQLTLMCCVSIAGAISVKREVESRKIEKGNIVKLYCLIMWKTKGVYGLLLYQKFDVVINVSVIVEYYTMKNATNVDPRAMAWVSLAIMIFYRVTSTIFIWVKERNFSTAFLQFFDVLIFREAYSSYRKIMTQLVNDKLDDKRYSVQTTELFKYLMYLQVVFSTCPSNILTVGYLIREGNFSPIIYFSLAFSMYFISCTVSSIDNIRMQHAKWNTYKQAFPPTFRFLKHQIFRFSEPIYRCGLLSLLWAVCGGTTFSVIISVELLIIIGRSTLSMYADNDRGEYDLQTALTDISSLFIFGMDDFYGDHSLYWHHWMGSDELGISYCIDVFVWMGICFANFCNCIGLTALVMSLCTICCGNEIPKVSFSAVTKISVSFTEFAVLIVYVFFAENEEGEKYLLSFDHGLGIFIATCVAFCIYTQYLMLLPNASFPFNVRSKWSYAILNELESLQRIKVPYHKMDYDRQIKCITKDSDDHHDDIYYEVMCEADFWDEPYVFYYTNKPNGITASVIAKALQYYDVVKWLEKRGAISHNVVDSATEDYVKLSFSRYDIT